jgi:hypothetical protein
MGMGCRPCLCLCLCLCMTAHDPCPKGVSKGPPDVYGLRDDLMHATVRRHETVTKQLIAARCNVDLQEEDGTTHVGYEKIGKRACFRHETQLVTACCNVKLLRLVTVKRCCNKRLR